MKALHVKNSWFSDSDLRLDASYHLSDGPIAKAKLKCSPYKSTTLINECDRIFSGNIFKRTYVESDKKGWPYLTGSDMIKADINSGKFISKKYTTQAQNLRIKKDWILISCSGTLGNCVYTNDEFAERIGTHDLIRAIPNEKSVKKGFLYAYLSSRYGYGLLTQSSYGGVVKHIEPHHIQDIPIPVLPDSKQGEIDDLIKQSSSLRINANAFLIDAINLFESRVGKSAVSLGFQCDKISIHSINGFQKRLDGQFQLLWKRLKKEKSSEFEYLPLSSLASSIFVGGRGKRNYVEKGVPFLSSSEMMLFNPKRGCKQVSKNNPGLNSMTVSKSDILISRSGTVGNTILVGDDLVGTAISEHALRLVIDDNKISPNYVFCFLKTKQGMKSMEASSFGSVIITLNEDLIGNIEIPILEKDIQKEIHDLIESYSDSLDEATSLENKAIELVENEIESWQKS
jgi:restriction endonuclease S subunit